MINKELQKNKTEKTYLKGKSIVYCDLLECNNNTKGVCQSTSIVFTFNDYDFEEVCASYSIGEDN